MALWTKPLVPARDQAREIWAARLARFADSDLTVAAFCGRERVSVPTFYSWKRRLGDGRPPAAAGAPRLLPVRLVAGPTPVELLLPGGAVVRLSPGCDLDFVRTLLATLGGLPC